MNPSSRRSDYISALRGISALAIIMYHMFTLHDFHLGPLAARYIPQLWMGVALFFMLSAYSLCLSARKRSGDSLASFYLRRFFRIAPLFYAVIAVIVFWRTVQGKGVAMEAVASNVTFVFNFILASDIYAGIIRASWCIGVLMPFYLVFPFLFRLCRTLAGTSWVFAASLAASYAFRLALHWIASRSAAQGTGPLPFSVDYLGLCSLAVNIPYLVLGIAAFHLHGLIDEHPAGRSGGNALLALALAGFIVVPCFSDQYLLAPVPLKYLLSLFFIPFILSLGINGRNPLINRFTVFFGEISYGSYLVHVLIIGLMLGLYEKAVQLLRHGWLAFVCCYALTVLVVTAVSYAAHRLIEDPGIDAGNRFEKFLKTRYPSAFRPLPYRHGTLPEQGG